MKKKNLLIFKVLIAVLVTCLCFSCHTKSSDLPELVKAERLMEQYPDSALHILENLSDSVHLSTEQNAMYCLLLTEAKDKTYAIYESDSLINIAVGYFENKKDLGLKAKAWFYKGRVTQELLDGEHALDCYLKAAAYAEHTNNRKLLGLIYCYAGNLYRLQKMPEQALVALEKSSKYFSQINDTINLSYILRDIGRVYLFDKNVDSAFVFYNKALTMVGQSNHKEAKASILNDLGTAYRQIRDYPNAISMIQSSIPLKTGEDLYTSYYSLARLHFCLENLDSVDFYLHKAEPNQNIFIQDGIYYYKYQLAKTRLDYKAALQYFQEYQLLKDSINKNQQKDEILKLTYQYEQRELKKGLEQKAAKERLIYVCSIFVLLSIIGFGSYLYIRNRWIHEQVLRLQEKKVQQEQELRLQSVEQIKLNIEQIENNKRTLIDKEKDLQAVQRELISYNTRYLKTENELITLRREELEFRNNLFSQTGLSERIRCAGIDFKKKDSEFVPFTMKDFPLLIQQLNSLYNNFVIRLQKRTPLLKDREIEICCLLKAGGKTGNIAHIIAMTPNAVTKKKRQIWCKLEIINEDISLEQFLDTF